MLDNSSSDAAFLESYDPRAFPPVAVTVDVVVLTIRCGRLCTLLIRRGTPPFAGALALPGGFLHVGSGVGNAQGEDLDEAAVRELEEETGLVISSEQQAGSVGPLYLEQLASYGKPGRDPRMRVVTVAYLIVGRNLPEPTAGSDARSAIWIPVEEVFRSHSAVAQEESVSGATGPDIDHLLAFDHFRILTDGLARVRSKIQYTPIALALLDEEFTLSELQEVFEVVGGDTLHASNFRRRVLSIQGFLENSGRLADRRNTRGGPRKQQLYRAGPFGQSYPGFLRVW